MSVQGEIERISNNVQSTLNIIADTGVEVGSGSDALPAAAAALANEKAPIDHTHSYTELTNKPSSFTPATHNQAASTITAGTFAGQVVAGSSYQTPGTYLLRNSRVATSEATPTVNGQISWLAE